MPAEGHEKSKNLKDAETVAQRRVDRSKDRPAASADPALSIALSLCAIADALEEIVVLLTPEPGPPTI